MSNLACDTIAGGAMEGIILLDTTAFLPKRYKVFEQFPPHEADMVIAKETASCVLVEVKHSDRTFESQYRHLVTNLHVSTWSPGSDASSAST